MESIWMEEYIGVVAHDAGGANLLASYCKRKPDNYRYYLKGPAKEIFKKSLSIESEDNLDSFISECHIFLCGTSGRSDLERTVIAHARILKKETTAILDHWVNYRERFVQSGKLVIPNKLITVDNYAYQIAKEAFPDCAIIKMQNLYLEDFCDHYFEISAQLYGNPKSEILFISEGFDEQNVEDKSYKNKDLEYFEKFILIKSRLFDSNLSLRIRLHPSEEPSKVQQYKEICPEVLYSDSSVDLAMDLSRAKCVVGISSMALVLANACGIQTFSLLESSKESRIPISGIKYLGPLPNFK